jgi:arylformamidase
MSGGSEAWRSWPLAQREREYSPSSCVPSSATIIAEYTSRSRQAERNLPCQKNLRWGDGPNETFDFFRAASPNAPLLLFIHGGYWQELSKNDSLFTAPDCVANGIAYAAIDYTLAPRANLAAIVHQCRRAVASLHRQAATLGFDSHRLFVAGSSAGAHLAAMLLVCGWHETYGVREDAIAGAVLLSGIYDLAPLIGTYIDAPLHLTSADATALSPIRLRHGRPVPAIVACGEFETGESKRQSRDCAEKLRVEGFSVSEFEAAGTNHFDIVFGLADGTTTLGRATLKLIAGTKSK